MMRIMTAATDGCLERKEVASARVVDPRRTARENEAAAGELGNRAGAAPAGEKGHALPGSRPQVSSGLVEYIVA